MIASPEQVERRLQTLRLLDEEAAAEFEREWSIDIRTAHADAVLPGLPTPVAGETAGFLRGQLLAELENAIANVLAGAELEEAIAAERARREAA